MKLGRKISMPDNCMFGRETGSRSINSTLIFYVSFMVLDNDHRVLFILDKIKILCVIKVSSCQIVSN